MERRVDQPVVILPPSSGARLGILKTKIPAPGTTLAIIAELLLVQLQRKRQRLIPVPFL